MCFLRFGADATVRNFPHRCVLSSINIECKSSCCTFVGRRLRLSHRVASTVTAARRRRRRRRRLRRFVGATYPPQVSGPSPQQAKLIGASQRERTADGYDDGGAHNLIPESCYIAMEARNFLAASFTKTCFHGKYYCSPAPAAVVAALLLLLFAVASALRSVPRRPRRHRHCQRLIYHFMATNCVALANTQFRT